MNHDTIEIEKGLNKVTRVGIMCVVPIPSLKPLSKQTNQALSKICVCLFNEELMVFLMDFNGNKSKRVFPQLMMMLL